MRFKHPATDKNRGHTSYITYSVLYPTQIIFSAHSNALGTSAKSKSFLNSNNSSCFQYQNCNFLLIATHIRTTRAVSPVNDLDRLTSNANSDAPFVRLEQCTNGKLWRLISFTLITLSDRLNSKLYSGITSTCRMGFLLKFLSNWSRVNSIRLSDALISTVYMSKWPCRVPSITFLSVFLSHRQWKFYMKHFEESEIICSLPKLVIHSMCTEILAGGKTTYASCIVADLLIQNC